MNSLFEASSVDGDASTGDLLGAEAAVATEALRTQSLLPDSLESLRGRSVLIATGEQFPTAVALMELDGMVRRMVLCPPELSQAQLAAVAAMAQADAVIVSEPQLHELPLTQFTLQREPVACRMDRRVSERTEWILLTSGTTGTPKLVLHTLESLAGTLPRRYSSASPTVWSTFYDIRRYGGLQIYLRAVLSGSSLVMSNSKEPSAQFLERAGAARVTHISGTPSHWRRALMSGALHLMNPQYVRLSGEVADQPILDRLRDAYPNAKIAHAFASTEAGVGFDVDDGLAGFPDTFVSRSGTDSSGITLKVTEGTLRIRSQRIGARYLGVESAALKDADGFIDTGDLVELVGDRYYFRGRRGGVINVGGLKVYPEEVEAVLNSDPRVRMSRVQSRRNPITGAVAVADVVLKEGADPTGDPDFSKRLASELLGACRLALPAHKVPALLRVVPDLEVNQAGKLIRTYA